MTALSIPLLAPLCSSSTILGGAKLSFLPICGGGNLARRNQSSTAI
jgi:hypothetical protein